MKLYSASFGRNKWPFYSYAIVDEYALAKYTENEKVQDMIFPQLFTGIYFSFLFHKNKLYLLFCKKMD